MDNKVYCNICNKIMTKNENNYQELYFHLKKEHNINYMNYVIEFKFNNERPKCQCGCGNYTNFYKGSFRKYYNDHKNKIKGYKNPKQIKTEIEKIDNIKKTLNSVNLSLENIINYYNKYINYEISMLKLSNEINLDKRTIIKYWNDLKLIKNKDDFERISKKHKNIWKINKPKIIIEDDILIDIKMFLDNNSNKFTLKEIITKFDLQNISKLVLYKRLIEKFDECDIKSKLNTGNVSKPELEYFNILKYFYGNDIKQQFRLNGKIYDYIILGKILIEFDGNYWHSQPDKILNDKYKDEIAKNNDYIIIRVKDNESNNINILNKINKHYEKIKNCRNKK